MALSMKRLKHVLELFMPRECLVCRRSLRGSRLCLRCNLPAIAHRIKNDSATCVRCDIALPVGKAEIESPTCGTCVLFPPPFRYCRVLFPYRAEVRDYIQALKYRPSYYLAKRASAIVSQTVHVKFPVEGWDLIVPMPASPASLKKRTFNQSFILAARIARDHSNAGMVLEVLLHRGKNPPQASLPHEKRLHCSGNLILPRPELVRNKRILVIDDVMTTGVTVTEACQLLTRAGADSVDLLILARSLEWPKFRARVYHRLLKGL